MTFLLKNYEWRTIFWVYSGLSLFCVVFAFLLKPLKPKNNSSNNSSLSNLSDLNDLNSLISSKNVKKRNEINYKNMTFFLLCFGAFQYYLVSFVPTYFLPDMAKSNNVPDSKANGLVWYYGKWIVLCFPILQTIRILPGRYRTLCNKADPMPIF